MSCLPKKTAKKTDSLSKCAEASLGAQNREQSGQKIWAPDRTCHRWAQGSHCWFICLFIQHAIKSCPEQGRGIALGWIALPIPRTHSLFLGCQETLPRPGPASGNLSGVSTGTQDFSPQFLHHTQGFCQGSPRPWDRTRFSRDPCSQYFRPQLCRPPGKLLLTAPLSRHFHCPWKMGQPGSLSVVGKLRPWGGVWGHPVRPGRMGTWVGSPTPRPMLLLLAISRQEALISSTPIPS